MRRIAAVVIAAALVLLAAPAHGATCTGHPRIGAYLDSSRHCVGDLTVYEVVLHNDTKARRAFRATEVRRGVLLSADRHIVPRRSGTSLFFYIPSGRRSAVTVTFRGEVILHRRLGGICYA